MRVLTSTLVAAGILAGLIGAVVGYRAVTAAPDQKPASLLERVHQATPAVQPRVQLLPCERGWTQRGKACVKVVTKVVYSGSASSAAGVPAPVVRTTAASRPVHRSTAPHTEEPSHTETPQFSEPSDTGDGPTGSGSQPAYDD